MNEKLPYEKHLADKLQQLPPPDVDRSWEQMKVLLDKELPPGGGFGSHGGGSRRWLFPAIAGALVIGTWFARDLFREPKPGSNTVPVAIAPADRQTSSSSTAVAPGQPGAANPANRPPGNGRPEDITLAPPATGRSPALPLPPRTTGQAEQPLADHNTIQQQNDPLHEAISTQQKDQTPGPGKSHPPKNTEAAIAGNRLPDPGIPGNTINNSSRNDTRNGRKGKPAEKGNSRAEKATGTTDITSTGKIGTEDDHRQPLLPGNAEDRLPEGTFTASIVAGPAGELSFTSPAAALPQMPGNGSVAIATEDNTAAQPAPRAGRGREGHRFAIGLSLPMVFPIADQQPAGYNYWAGPNTVSDYIPTPHVQYHFDHKTYLQTELQFLAPQYIRPVLMYQHKENMQGAYMVHSVFARKLYYFNLPVSIHHSPLPNFYLGSGLQFSTLMNCVALYEDRRVQGPQNYLIREQYAKLGGDSLSKRVNESEIRLLIDVNYYWHRFTVGLRYNQAFNNYANFQMSNISPFTYDKNKAVLFYLRYNIWETKKRSNGSTMLSLK